MVVIVLNVILVACAIVMCISLFIMLTKLCGLKPKTNNINKAMQENIDSDISSAHELESKVYPIESLHYAIEGLKEICNNSLGKVKLINLDFTENPYGYSTVKCKYESIGNMWLLDLQQEDGKLPMIAIVERHVW